MKVKINYADVTLVTFLLFLWQFPQCFLGLSLYFLLKIEPVEYFNSHTGMTVLWIPTKWNVCWSLGMFIFAHPDSDEMVLKHESGHCLQSLILGPVYLFAVALPSIILFWIRRGFNKSLDWYKSRYPENWADKLGGVNSIKD